MNCKCRSSRTRSLDSLKLSDGNYRTANGRKLKYSTGRSLIYEHRAKHRVEHRVEHRAKHKVEHRAKHEDKQNHRLYPPLESHDPRFHGIHLGRRRPRLLPEDGIHRRPAPKTSDGA